MNKIIAVSGLKNSGKDTVANMLQYLLNTPKIFHSYFWYKHKNWINNNHNYERIAFATPIKRMLASLLYEDLEKFNDRDFKENCYVNLANLTLLYNHSDCNVYETISDSKFSKLAKEWNPELSKQYWLSIRQLMQLFGTEIMRNIVDDKIWIHSILRKSRKKNLIISDLRFITEYNELKKENAITIYIDRGLQAGSHKSESEMITMFNQNKFDYIIDNKTCSLEELFNKCKELIKNFK